MESVDCLSYLFKVPLLSFVPRSSGKCSLGGYSICTLTLCRRTDHYTCVNWERRNPSLPVVLVTAKSGMCCLYSVDFSFSWDDCDTMVLWLGKQASTSVYTHFSFEPYLQLSMVAMIAWLSSLVIQPTRKGKSQCYQLVALQQNQLVFVLVPTLALMFLM